MAKIIQQKIFSWMFVEASGELERLRMVIEALPDDELMKALEAERKGRRKSEGRQKFLPPTPSFFARPSDWISEFSVRIFFKKSSDFNQKAPPFG